MRLLGIDPAGTPLRPGEALPLTLYGQAVAAQHAGLQLPQRSVADGRGGDGQNAAAPAAHNARWNLCTALAADGRGPASGGGAGQRAGCNAGARV